MTEMMPKTIGTEVQAKLARMMESDERVKDLATGFALAYELLRSQEEQEQ